MTIRPKPETSRRWQLLWWVLAYLSLILGIIGIVLPLVPTVPFILLAAYAASRGSQRLHDWLLAHPQTGPMIRDWQTSGTVSRNAKWWATSMMFAAALILFFFSRQWWLATIVSVMMALIATWLWLRPEPPR